MFKGRKNRAAAHQRASSQPPATNSAALLAAAQAYHPSPSNPNSSLSASAAAAALKSSASSSSPSPQHTIGSIPTKRMLSRQGSYSSSVGSPTMKEFPRVASPRITRAPSNASLTMSERQFRSGTPNGGNRRPHTSSGSGIPPVPEVPRDTYARMNGVNGGYANGNRSMPQLSRDTTPKPRAPVPPRMVDSPQSRRQRIRTPVAEYSSPEPSHRSSRSHSPSGISMSSYGDRRGGRMDTTNDEDSDDDYFDDEEEYLDGRMPLRTDPVPTRARDSGAKMSYHQQPHLYVPPPAPTPPSSAMKARFERQERSQRNPGYSLPTPTASSPESMRNVGLGLKVGGTGMMSPPSSVGTHQRRDEASPSPQNRRAKMSNRAGRVADSDSEYGGSVSGRSRPTTSSGMKPRPAWVEEVDESDGYAHPARQSHTVYADTAPKHTHTHSHSVPGAFTRPSPSRSLSSDSSLRARRRRRRQQRSSQSPEKPTVSEPVVHAPSPIAPQRSDYFNAQVEQEPHVTLAPAAPTVNIMPATPATDPIASGSHRNITPSPTPSRTRFLRVLSGPEIPTVKHDPLPRSVSPGKSALKKTAYQAYYQSEGESDGGYLSTQERPAGVNVVGDDSSSDDEPVNNASSAGIKLPSFQSVRKPESNESARTSTDHTILSGSLKSHHVPGGWISTGPSTPSNMSTHEIDPVEVRAERQRMYDDSGSVSGVSIYEDAAETLSEPDMDDSDADTVDGTPAVSVVAAPLAPMLPAQPSILTVAPPIAVEKVVEVHTPVKASVSQQPVKRTSPAPDITAKKTSAPVTPVKQSVPVPTSNNSTPQDQRRGGSTLRPSSTSSQPSSTKRAAVVVPPQTHSHTHTNTAPTTRPRSTSNSQTHPQPPPLKFTDSATLVNTLANSKTSVNPSTISQNKKTTPSIISNSSMDSRASYALPPAAITPRTQALIEERKRQIAKTKRAAGVTAPTHALSRTLSNRSTSSTDSASSFKRKKEKRNASEGMGMLSSMRAQQQENQLHQHGLLKKGARPSSIHSDAPLDGPLARASMRSPPPAPPVRPSSTGGMFGFGKKKAKKEKNLGDVDDRYSAPQPMGRFADSDSDDDVPPARPHSTGLVMGGSGGGGGFRSRFASNSDSDEDLPPPSAKVAAKNAEIEALARKIAAAKGVPLSSSTIEPESPTTSERKRPVSTSTGGMAPVKEEAEEEDADSGYAANSVPTKDELGEYTNGVHTVLPPSGGEKKKKKRWSLFGSKDKEGGRERRGSVSSKAASVGGGSSRPVTADSGRGKLVKRNSIGPTAQKVEIVGGGEKKEEKKRGGLGRLFGRK